MKKRLHHHALSLAARLWILSAVLVILLAAGLSFMRLWLPGAVSEGGELGEYLSGYVGRPVEVGEVAARWWRWGPEFTLRDVKVLDPGDRHVMVQVREARIAVDLIGSLRQRTLQPSRLTLVGARIGVERLAGGGVRLAGFGTTGGGGEWRGPEPAAWLMAQSHVLIEQGGLDWHDQRTGTTLHLGALTLGLSNDGDRHRLEGRGVLTGTETGRVHFLADMRGGADAMGAWDGRLWLETENLPIGRLLAEIRELPPLPDGRLGSELWGEVRDGRLETLEGSLRLNDLRPPGDAETPPAALSCELGFSRLADADGWDLAVSGLRYAQGSRATPPTDARARLIWGAGPLPAELRVRVERAAVADLAPWLAAYLPPGMAAAVRGTAPTGRLEGLDFVYRDQDGGAPQMTFGAAFHELGSREWERLPGVAGLSGRLVADPAHGWLQLDSTSVRLDLRRLFREPIAITRIDAGFHWWRDAAGWHVSGRDGVLGNDDIRIPRLGLDLLLPPEGGPELDLLAELRDADGSRVSSYLPVGIMPEKSVAWLDRSLVSGRASEGFVRIAGPLRAFPFDHGEGRFEVRAQVEDFVLDYTPGWPRLEGVRAELRFLGRGMEIRAGDGRIFGSRIESARATIADLHGKPAILEVKGRTRGPGADGLRYLFESPLKERFARYLSTAEVEGEIALDLDLSLPLAHDMGVDQRVAGAVHFDGNTLRFRDLDLELDEAGGTLSFTTRSLAGTGLRARYLGQPVTLAVTAGAGNREGLEVEAGGRMSIKALALAFPNPVFAWTEGRAPFRARVAVREDPASGQLASTLTVNSDLEGVAVALPEPLGKPAATRRPLELTLSLGAGERILRADYGGLATVAGRLKPGPEAVAVVLGGEAELPATPGLSVSGRLARAALDEWTGFLETGGSRGGPGLARLDLQVDTLAALGRSFKQVGVVLVPAADGGWRTTLAGPQVQGAVTIPADRSKPLDIALERLVWPPAAPAPDGRAAEPIDPAGLPPLALRCAALVYDGRELGGLILNTVPGADGLQLETLKLEGGALALDVTGEWRRESGGRQWMRLKGRLSARNTGKALASLGFAVGINEGKGRGDFEVVWSGGPGDFALARVDGEITLRVDEGQLEDVQPGVGRVFGLLSLPALRRRLSLDFSDLVKEGFAFDRMEGHFTLDAGNAYTNDFYIKGPSARIEVAGRTGLVTRDYDQVITVTPELGGSLSVAGAIAGGPVAGAAVLVLQKVFQTQIEQITRAQYTLKGTWDDPEMERVQREEDRPSGPGDQR
ncbi:MAG: YhdP family protein [Gammaproteobacteria bacterium]|nr:YhdP family protein [Gammaproteobacteria bacterium]